jgi:regulatory protein
MRLIPTEPIEGIEVDPRREGAVRLIVGGRTALIVPAEAVQREGIKVGSVIPAASGERLLQAMDDFGAYRTAIGLLGRRPYARKDLGRRLVMKGHPKVAVEAALDRAQRLGYLDDERFARHFVQTRSARGRGPARLRRELTMQGVSPAVAERVLTEEVSAEASSGQLLALAQKRINQLAGLPRPDRVRRVVAFLARRGFTGSAVVQLVKGL